MTFNYLNGQILPSEETKIHVSDLALLRGYGIFDFFRVIDKRPIFLDDHLDRFENGAKLMNLPISENREKLKEIILELIRLNPHDLLSIRLVLTGGYSPDGFNPGQKSNLIIITNPFIFKDPEIGIKLMSLNYRREIPEVKTLNYVLPIKMLPQMKSVNADDYLYFYNGFISESSRSNVFIVKNEKVITPKTGVLAGITRKHVIKACQSIFDVEERDVSLEETLAADEVFITATTYRVNAVTQIDNQIINQGKIGKITKKIYDLLLKEEYV